MTHWTDQEEAQIEFLRYLGATNGSYDPVILVLRGSLLLRHWFGAQARAAADLDFECFERVRGQRGPRFPSIVDHGRGICVCATEQSWEYRQARQYLMFEETDPDVDSQSLWAYGTPGERFFANWAWQGEKQQRGRMQIDIAAAGTYAVQEIGVADVTLAALDGTAFSFPAYTAEAMLAAKLSWLMRGLAPREQKGLASNLAWKGQAKDLFDVHLLLSKPDLNATAFQKSLLAVGTEDKLDWLHLDTLIRAEHLGMSDDDFGDWPAFRAQHPRLAVSSPVAMLHTSAERLEPLLGDLYLRAEMRFLHAIQAERMDEANLLIYSDWLEEHGHEQRSAFLRLFAQMQFRIDELALTEQALTHAALQSAFRKASVPWLHCLCGTSARYHELTRRILSDSATALRPSKRPWWRFW